MYKILKLFTVLAVVFAFSPVSRAQTVVDGNTAKFLREFDDKKIKPAHIDTFGLYVERRRKIGS